MAGQVFAWEGTDRSGRKAKGEIASSNANVAKAELRKQGIKATKVKKKSAALSLGGGGKITPQDICLFTRQLATMMKAGVPLVQSFEIVADGVDKAKLRELILAIKDDVSSGNSFASAIHNQPREYFDDLFCNLVDAGEQSGALETMLDRLATYKEKSEKIKAQIKAAMKYPISVLAVAGIVSGLLLVKVVPQFEEIFHGFGAELPEFTQMVVNMSKFMQAYWWVFVVGMAGTFFAYQEAYKRSKELRDGQDRLMLKLPVFGDLLDKTAVARFARTLSTTFAAGVPLVDALESVAGAAGNVVYYDAIKKVKDDVSSGIQLNVSMKQTGAFPNMVIQMVAIGEESGALDAMLDKAATYYEEQVDAAVEGLSSLMEPIIMSILGVLIGGLIIAMYLPIFNMGKVVGGGGGG